MRLSEAGSIAPVTRFVRWLMVACLLFVQVHYLVPHHHHGTDSPKHIHAGMITTDGSAIDAAHPELAGPYDLPSDAASRRYQKTPLQIFLIARLPGMSFVREQVLVLHSARQPVCGLPYGPPASSIAARAPPVSFA